MIPLIEVKGVSKCFGQAVVLDDCSFEVEAGKLTALIGWSGSGKTTLLNMVGGLLQADRGSIVVAGREISKLSGRDRAAYRCSDVGFVFQDFSLLEDYTILENICLVAGFSPDPVNTVRLEDLLERLDLEKVKDKLPCEVSGGEKQRTALARALLTEPAVVLADEPTGNLDRLSGQVVLSLFRECVRVYGQTVLMVTHDLELAKQCDRILEVKDGKVIPYGSS